ncbi:MAG: HIT family protein [Planctomycetota bacterium]
MSCIFCRILQGEIPSARVYEDAHAVAFLDINPLAPGHTLVVTRNHHSRVWEVPEAELAGLMAAVKRVSRAIVSATHAEGLNLLANNGPVAGQVVPHVHFHLIPRRNGDGILPEWKPREYQPGEMDAVLKKISDACAE